MKHLQLSFLVFLLIIASCKKSKVEVEEPTRYTDIQYTDSVSFSINGKDYMSTDRYSSGWANRQVNIKRSDTLITGRKAEYMIGGFYWYGEKDSTLYSISAGFVDDAPIKISFHKKFGNNEMKGNNFLYPSGSSLIFNKGEQPFAVDLNLENTMEGVSIEVYTKELKDLLSTYIPGFSRLTDSKLPRASQEESSFEVTKLQLLENGIYLVEARFEANLFDDQAKMYKLKNGFLRLKTYMKRYQEL